MLIHKGDQKKINNKKAKLAPKAQQSILVGCDGKTIYHVYFEKNNKVIKVKDLQIHKDATSKNSTDLSTYEAISVDK